MTLRNRAFDLDSKVGKLSVEHETLVNIKDELSMITDDVKKIDKGDYVRMGVIICGIEHRLELISDLMNFVVKEQGGSVEEIAEIKEAFFKYHVNGEEDEEK